MKIQQDMRIWLDKDYLKREIRPKFHVNGWRVTLYYDYYEVCTGWGDSIEKAFSDAEKHFDVSLAKLLEKALANAEKRREDEMRDHENRIQRIRNQQQAVTALIAKLVHES